MGKSKAAQDTCNVRQQTTHIQAYDGLHHGEWLRRLLHVWDAACPCSYS